jgi:hypothetical protein
VAGRRGPRHCRVRGNVGRYSGVSGGHSSSNRKQRKQCVFVRSKFNSIKSPGLAILGTSDKQMYLAFLLFVIVIVLVLIFWELSKINSRLKKTLIVPNDTVKGDKDQQL